MNQIKQNSSVKRNNVLKILNKTHKQLTQALKTKWLPLLIRRDEGFSCFYCLNSLWFVRFIFEHLNNNREDNRPENLVLACITCNNKKPHYPEMQKKADAKLIENEKLSNYVSEKKIEKKIIFEETVTESEIGKVNFEITEQYITEKIDTDGFIFKTDALNSCALVCRRKTDYGSQPAVRRYLDALSSSEGPFEEVRDENKKKIIRRRIGK